MKGIPNFFVFLLAPLIHYEVAPFKSSLPVLNVIFWMFRPLNLFFDIGPFFAYNGERISPAGGGGRSRRGVDVVVAGAVPVAGSQ